MKKTLFLLTTIAFVINSIVAQEQVTNPKSLVDFKKNNITISPLSLNNIGLGPAIQYERYLDKNNNFSFVFPMQFSVLIFGNNQSRNTTLDNSSGQFGISVNPGLRMYFVEPRRFNWFIGTSFLFGSFSSKGSFYNYDNNGNFNLYNKNEIFQLGSLVNVGFKGTISNRVTYQLEYGNGIGYVYKEKLSESSTASDVSFKNQIKYIPNLQVGFGFIF